MTEQLRERNIFKLEEEGKSQTLCAFRFTGLSCVLRYWFLARFMNGRFIDLLWVRPLNSLTEDNKSFIFYPTQVPSCPIWKIVCLLQGGEDALCFLLKSSSHI